jgi:pimeloyl-ACP methyl ester carboxylesterase
MKISWKIVGVNMALDDDSCTCALLARAIYRPGDIGEMLAGWHGMSVCKIWTQDMFYRHLATAILLRREGETVGYLAFKGSSYFYDWLADGLVVPKPAVSGTAHCHYHSGFYNTCRSVSDSIVTAMTYCGIGSLVVTGHSLGGALAGTFALLHPS